MILLSRNRGITHKVPNVNLSSGIDHDHTVCAILDCPRTSVSKYCSPGISKYSKATILSQKIPPFRRQQCRTRDSTLPSLNIRFDIETVE